MTASTPLSGLRVVECGSFTVAFAGRLLADGGASVVRLAPPGGDPLSAEPPFFGQSGVSIQDAWYNAGKELLAARDERATLLALLPGADVLLAGWAPGEEPLSLAEMEAAAPHLAVVSVTAAGGDGPWAHLHANDLVHNALSGSASVTGDADTPPLTGYGNHAHHTAGFYAAICALAAHRAAKASGRFQHVDFSEHEALATCTEQVLMQWFFPQGSWDTPIARRQGSLHWSGAYEVYPGRTGTGIMVTTALKFAETIIPWLQSEGAAQGLTDPSRYPDLLALIRDLPYVMKVMREWVATWDAEELFFESQRRHQPWGVVRDLPGAIASPQVAARGYLQTREVPGFGAVPFPGRFFRTNADGPHPAPPMRADARPAWPPRPAPAPATNAPRPGRPLEGVRILDFTHVLAGPFGTRVLGDLGAEVIKVSSAMRNAGANSQIHPYYVCWNRNKKSINLDMSTAGGRRTARRLAAASDAVIENFSAGVLARWGLDRASMAAEAPGLSVISMGGMGQDGPWKDFVTYAPTIHALVGLTWMTNTPGRHNIGYGFSLTDHLSGLCGAFAVLQGIEHRERTGQGLAIDLSQFELGLGIMAPSILDHLANGAAHVPVGNRHPFGAWAPHGIYRCAGEDRWVAIAARGDAEWAALCTAMGRPALATETRFATHALRIANQDTLDAAIEAWTAARDRYDVMAICQAAGIAAGAVQDARDLTGADSQLAHRQFFGTAESSTWGQYGVDRFPARFNGTRPDVYEGVHDVGTDTFDVLATVLGLDSNEIADLAAEGALS